MERKTIFVSILKDKTLKACKNKSTKMFYPSTVSVFSLFLFLCFGKFKNCITINCDEGKKMFKKYLFLFYFKVINVYKYVKFSNA